MNLTPADIAPSVGGGTNSLDYTTNFSRNNGKNEMKAQANGWGIQSVTLAWMQALGEIERCDVLLNSDTTHESSLTYDYIQKWTPELESHGLNLVTVSAGEVPARVWKGEFIPAYTTGENGFRGKAFRSCTERWKIRPMRRWLRENHPGEQVEMWLGISMDEYQRMKDSDVKYIKNRWPLIEKRFTRQACLLWLDDHGIEAPPKSACVFCPFHDNYTWQEIKNSGNGDWTKAVEVDQAIRKARPPYDLFVHPARIPLEEVDLRTPREKGQLSLWSEECSGICGV
jgi:hypothetical protein